MAKNAPNVLVLEDEGLISMELELILEDAGFNVTSATSCVEATSWLKNHVPDIVVVDIELRDGICTEVVARLIEMKVPFVVYSADAHALHVGTPFEHGTWVGKPAPGGRIVEAVVATSRSSAMMHTNLDQVGGSAR